jgi:hypothetical protein
MRNIVQELQDFLKELRKIESPDKIKAKIKKAWKKKFGKKPVIEERNKKNERKNK